MNIIGINAYHGDASAALVQEGQLVAAVEEERVERLLEPVEPPRNGGDIHPQGTRCALERALPP